MVNSLTAASPTYWAKNAEKKFYKTTFFQAIANFSEEANVTDDGRIIDRPYRSSVIAENYTKGTALTAQDLTYTEDLLTIDQQYSLLMYVDKIDKIQNKYNTVRLWSEEAGRRLGVKADSKVLYEVYNASSDIDASDLGGTAAEGITTSASNVYQIFGEINEQLDVLNVPQEERYLVISPMFKNKLWQYIQGKESMLGDRTGETGNIGTFAGLKLYLSTNLPNAARWTPADNPTTAATITIEAITFTFVDSIGTTAGNILQTTDLATTLDQTVAFINGGGLETATDCTAATCQSLSTANQRIVQNWVAYDGTTYLEVRVKGSASNALTLTSSESSDTWDTKYQNHAMLAGRKGAIDVAIQTKGEMGIIDVEMASTVSAGKLGTNVMPLLLMGVKTFYTGLDELVKVLVRADS